MSGYILFILLLHYLLSPVISRAITGNNEISPLTPKPLFDDDFENWETEDDNDDSKIRDKRSDYYYYYYNPSGSGSSSFVEACYYDGTEDGSPISEDAFMDMSAYYGPYNEYADINDCDLDWCKALVILL